MFSGRTELHLSAHNESLKLKTKQSPLLVVRLTRRLFFVKTTVKTFFKKLQKFFLQAKVLQHFQDPLRQLFDLLVADHAVDIHDDGAQKHGFCSL